jgi:hypothetical protein
MAAAQFIHHHAENNFDPQPLPDNAGAVASKFIAYAKTEARARILGSAEF